MQKKKPRVAVFYGGGLDNRDLSLATGEWFLEHMPRAQYDVIPVHVTAQRQWQVPLGSLPRQGGVNRVLEMLMAAVPVMPPAQALPRLLSREPDVFFTLLREAGGDDGAMQMLANTVGISAVGSPPVTCAVTSDKRACARAIEPVAMSPFTIPAEQATWSDFGEPVFVKRASAEGSTGVVRIEDGHEFENIRERRSDQLVQEARLGQELTVTVYQDAEGNIRGLPPTTIIPVKATYFDALAKRRSGRVKLVATDTHNTVSRRAMQLAQDIYELLHCRGVVTIDMIAHPHGIDVLEVNTVPVAGAHAPLASQLESAGVQPNQFIDSVIRESVARGV